MSQSEAPYIREVQAEDLPQLKPLFEYWMRDSVTGQIKSSEVDDTLRAVEKTALGGNERMYIVAEDDGGTILGIMGITEANDKLAAVSPAEEQGNAAELINAFVAPAARGQGIGKLLSKYLVSTAKQLAYDEILVISGPRYQDSGWPFWTSMCGEPFTTQKDTYGPGIDGTIWRKPLHNY